MVDSGSHYFEAGVCLKCAIRQKDSEFRYYQFCTDELRVFNFLCESDRRVEIENIYSNFKDPSERLRLIVGYSSRELPPM